jgi:hypothetical protein
MKRIFDKPRGQMMVLYSAALAFALAGAVALCTDVGVMYMDWQHMQKIADASALAGANYLDGFKFTGTVGSGCGGKDDATKVACTYAVDNGIAAGDVNATDTATTVTVQAHLDTQPYFFAKVLGMSTYAVSATAVSTAPGPVNNCNGCGLFPAGLQCKAPCKNPNKVAGEPLSFGTKFNSTVINANGNWGWLALDGPGGNVLRTSIENGATGNFAVGDLVNTKPGGNNGPIDQSINNRLGKNNSKCTASPDPCSGGNPNEAIPVGDPCLVIVPVVDFTNLNGTSQTAIEGFAEIYLQGPVDHGNINGCFISTVAADTRTGSGAPNLGPTAPPVLIR